MTYIERIWSDYRSGKIDVLEAVTLLVSPEPKEDNDNGSEGSGVQASGIV